MLATDQTAMRAALSEAVLALLNQQLTFTGPVPATGVGVLASHINQLRSAVK